MWIIFFIIFVIGFIIVKFASDSNKQATEVTKQGGMKTKYRTLINYLVNSDPKARILNEGVAFISIGSSSIGGTTIFDILQTFGSVTIQWKVNSPVWGKHNLEWSFNEFADQNDMIEKIENDLSQYQANVMRKFM